MRIGTGGTGVFGRCLALIGACVFALLARGCAESGGGQALDDERPVVVATVGMVADLAREIGGDRIVVESLIRPGVDPHLYAPTRRDIQRLLDADLVLANGLRLEGKFTDALARAGKSGRMVVAVAEGLDPGQILHADGGDHADPHVWMDPEAWSGVVPVVLGALAAIDPEGAPAYEANASALLDRLAALTLYTEEVLATVPAGSRVLVTAHDAFGYFARRFGFEVVGIQGISTESEAGLRDIERIVTMLVDRRVPAVFTETTVSDRNVRALIAGAKARGWEVRAGGSLFSDAMGDEGSYEGTYIGMIDHNVTMIARALGGEAPARGMQGRLADE